MSFFRRNGLFESKIMSWLTLNNASTDVFGPLCQSMEIWRIYIFIVAVHQKYLTRLGELIIFEPWRENYHFSKPRYDNTMYVFYLCFRV